MRYLSAIKNGRDNSIRRLRPSTQKAYANHLRRFVVSYGDRPIDSITSLDLRAYKNELLRAGRSREYAAATFTTLRRSFRYAHETGHLNQNPFDHVFGIKVDRSGKPINRESFYSPQELATLLTWLQARADRNASFPSRRDHALISSLCFAGLRIGEALALERGDVDFDGMLIRVRRTTVAGHTIMAVARRKLRREIPIPPRLRDILQPYLLSHDNKLVFCKRESAVLSHATVHSIWRAATTRAGLRYRPIKSLRHYYASRLIDSGYDDEFELMRLLGIVDYDRFLTTYRQLFFLKSGAVEAMARVSL